VSPFECFLFGVSVAGGFVGSISGFGIGSLVTPLVASAVGTKVAVAVVSLPHFVGTAIRFWTLRRSVKRGVLLTFGLTSAAGGLAGAFLYAAADNPLPTLVLAALLVFAGATSPRNGPHSASPRRGLPSRWPA
jgi:uncharacterized membrane protein YfcA